MYKALKSKTGVIEIVKTDKKYFLQRNFSEIRSPDKKKLVLSFENVDTARF